MQQDKLSLEERLAIIRDTAEPIKKLAADNKVVDFLYNNANTFTLNANDTFAYACSDSVDIVIEDLPKLLEVFDKYGNDGINAFMALVREQEVLKELQDDKYLAAVEYLKDYKPCSWIG